MHEVWEIAKKLVNPEQLIQMGGVGLLFLIVFAETGLFIGFFLPGDSLLFTAGLLTASGVIKWPVEAVSAGIFVSAVLGDMVGYAFGKKSGEAIYHRPKTFFFKPKHIVAARDFYERKGGAALVLGRFLPVIRTFAPIVAGVVEMPYKIFILYNIIGAFLWTAVMVLTGYFLGLLFPGISKYLEYIILSMVIFTAIPVYRSIRTSSLRK
jgi:membrane-associated protein